MKAFLWVGWLFGSLAAEAAGRNGFVKVGMCERLSYFLRAISLGGLGFALPAMLILWNR